MSDVLGGGRRAGVIGITATVRSHPSWAMVTWGSPFSPVNRQSEMYENITFPQLGNGNQKFSLRDQVCM